MSYCVFVHVVISLKHVSATDEGDYQNIVYSVSDRTGLVFGVTACRDVHIALSEIPGILTHSTYELVIGVAGVSGAILRNGINGQTLTETNTAYLLDCTEMRMFWLSWAAGTISLGKGTVVAQNRILFLKDASFKGINAISVMTPVGVLGSFTFEHFSGNLQN